MQSSNEMCTAEVLCMWNRFDTEYYFWMSSIASHHNQFSLPFMAAWLGVLTAENLWQWYRGSLPGEWHWWQLSSILSEPSTPSQPTLCGGMERGREDGWWGFPGFCSCWPKIISVTTTTVGWLAVGPALIRWQFVVLGTIGRCWKHMQWYPWRPIGQRGKENPVQMMDVAHPEIH